MKIKKRKKNKHKQCLMVLW